MISTEKELEEFPLLSKYKNHGRCQLHLNQQNKMLILTRGEVKLKQKRGSEDEEMR